MTAAPWTPREEAAERAYIAEYVNDPRLGRWIATLDATREALERCHYWAARGHDPEFDHGHPVPLAEGRRCGLCAAISECETCHVLRGDGATPEEPR